MKDSGLPLPPLDTAGVLWLAAIDRVPIQDRIEWVKTMLAQVEQINATRARRLITKAEGAAGGKAVYIRDSDA